MEKYESGQLSQQFTVLVSQQLYFRIYRLTVQLTVVISHQTVKKKIALSAQAR